MNCNFMNNSKTFCLSARHNLLEILFISSTAYTQQRLPKYGVTSFLASMVFPKDLQLHTVFNTLKILEGVVGKTGQGSTCEGIHAEVGAWWEKTAKWFSDLFFCFPHFCIQPQPFSGLFATLHSGTFVACATFPSSSSAILKVSGFCFFLASAGS